MMTHIRKWALAACLALLSLSYSVSNAQLIDQSTGNLVGGTWAGASTSTLSPGGLSGGSQPTYNSSTGTLMFGYSQGMASQTIAINSALANAGTGVQVSGYQYSWQYYNQDMSRGSLTGNISLTGVTGATIQSYNYTMPKTTSGWTEMSGVQNFTSPYDSATLSQLKISFTGKDDRFWAGYYGPMVKDVDVRLHYGIDPCATNPAYSTSCAGFNSVVESANLVPNPNGYAVFGDSVNNSFALNKAFEMAGTGLLIHGFKWGYVANANGPYCAFEFIVCWDQRNPSVTTNVNITNSAGASLYSVTRTYQDSYNTPSYKYLFPTSQQLGNLGSFNFSATTNDQSYVGQMWSKALYTPDICMINPLSSPTCPGYAKAMATQTTTTNTTTAVETTPIVVAAPVTSTNVSTSAAPVIDVAQPTNTITTASSSTTNTPTVATTAAPTTTATPSATNPQPKVGEVTTSGSQPVASKSTSVSTSQILSIVNSEQSRLNKLETTTAQTAIEQAKTEATKSINEAQSIATTLQTQSMANAQATATTLTTGQTFSSTSSSIQSSSGIGINVFGNQGVGISVFRGSDLYGLNQNQSAQYNQNSFQSPISTNVALLRRDREEVRTFDQNSTFEQRQSLSAANPLTVAMNPPPSTAQPQPSPSGPSVNANIKDNDAAGGVSIAIIAKQPQGFELYMGRIQDRPFYEPKEIYKGQSVVDNARAQRLLSGASDRLHQEMIDMQYNNKGN